MIIIRRGLTLLETLLASAILAMLAGACVPMLSAVTHSMSAGAVPDASASQALRFDLRTLADAFMLDPPGFGIKDLPKDVQRGDLSIPWPDRSAVVVIRELPSATKDAKHLWLEFSCEGQSVVRDLALPEEAATK